MFLIEDNENIEDLINKITKKVNPVKKSKMRSGSVNKKKNKRKKSLLGGNNVVMRKTIGNDLELESGEII